MPPCLLLVGKVLIQVPYLNADIEIKGRATNNTFYFARMQRRTNPAINDILCLGFNLPATYQRCVAYDDAAWPEIVLRLFMRPENAADGAFFATAVARLVSILATEFPFRLLQFRTHLPFERGAGNIGLERYRMLDAGQVGSANLQEIIAAAYPQPAHALNRRLNSKMLYLLHPYFLSLSRYAAPNPTNASKCRRKPSRKSFWFLTAATFWRIKSWKSLGIFFCSLPKASAAATSSIAKSARLVSHEAVLARSSASIARQ